MNKKVRKYRKIDEHSFNAVKTLINTGLSGREIQRAMSISQSTYWRIKKSETLDEYRAAVLQKNAPSKTEGEKVAERLRGLRLKLISRKLRLKSLLRS